jgi:hypothetical protein
MRPSDAIAKGIGAASDIICSRAKRAEHEIRRLPKDNPVVVLTDAAAAVAAICPHDAVRERIADTPDRDVTTGRAADPNP